MKWIRLISRFIGIFLLGTALQAQSSPDTTAPLPQGGEIGWKPPPKKEFTEKERQAECRKYQNKLIGYYSQVFKVENCKRREILSEELIQKWVKKGQSIFNVENETIIKIPMGDPIETEASHAKKFRCQNVEGRYVIAGASDIYYVDHCKRRNFPDWETFEYHRDQHRLQKKAVIELSEEDFQRIPLGKPYVSILDEAFKKLMERDEEVDVIPIDEACKGLNGHYVSYYSKVYKVEKCHKREVNDPDFGSRWRKGQKPFKELTSEQWLSLPNGEPL